jgi:hypothetical protein
MIPSVHFFTRTLSILRCPCVEIALFGDSSARIKFDHFNMPHPRFPLIRCKRWGVALLRLPHSFEDYLATHKDARKRRNKSIKSGYTFHEIEPVEYLEDILAINNSSPERQGSPVLQEYLDPGLVRSFFDQCVGKTYGVFCDDNRLVAYHHATICGDVCVSNRMFGHADHLKHGVMYYLLTESIRSCIDFRIRQGYPDWTMYDTTWGASEGMLRFKSRLGYAPHNVKWIWKEENCKCNQDDNGVFLGH